MRRIEDPPEADGVLGTAVPQATRCRAAIVRPIKVRSAAIRDADGTAIKLKLTPAQRYLFGERVAKRIRNFAAKISRFGFNWAQRCGRSF